MPELIFIIAYLGLGAIVGFFAGLLGIGGGGIMVPILTALFLAQGFDNQHVVHIALATAMASIIFTATSSVWSQHKRGAVIWPVVFTISPGIIFGTFISAYFVSYISTKYLALIFSICMALISLQMVLNKKPKPSRTLPSWFGLSFVGTIIGAISAVIAIAGGSLSVPFLTWCNVNIKKAIATSSGIGFFIAVSAVAGYFLGGYQQTGMPPLSTGYVYWPAVFSIAILSIFTAPLGVKMAHQMPVALLKKIFAAILIALSLKMLDTFMHQ